MYAVVLIAAMTSAGPSCHCQSGPVLCCPAYHGCCGVIQFFWTEPGIAGSISSEDTKLWNAYIEALADSERGEVQDHWKKTDDAGRLKLIAQVRAMRTINKDKEPDREVKKPTRSSRQLVSNRH